MHFRHFPVYPPIAHSGIKINLSSLTLMRLFFIIQLLNWKYCILTTWILHESEAFICKALKGEAIVHYAEPLIMNGAVSAARRVMEASGSPAGWKLMRLNRPSSFLLIRYLALLLYFSQLLVFNIISPISLIFMQDPGMDPNYTTLDKGFIDN